MCVHKFINFCKISKRSNDNVWQTRLMVGLCCCCSCKKARQRSLKLWGFAMFKWHLCFIIFRRRHKFVMKLLFVPRFIRYLKIKMICYDIQEKFRKVKAKYLKFSSIKFQEVFHFWLKLMELSQNRNSFGKLSLFNKSTIKYVMKDRINHPPKWFTENYSKPNTLNIICILLGSINSIYSKISLHI